MREAARRRLGLFGDEEGLTLVELLVASAMGVVLLGGVGAMVVSAMNRQPEISERSANVQTARWVAERLTKEIRNGIAVDRAATSSVSFRTYVRRTACGSGVPTDPATPAIRCEVTHTCSATSCTRIEAAEGVYTGTPTTIFSGIDSGDVFCFVPSTNPDPLTCGPAAAAGQVTYVGIRFRIPNPSGPGALTVSDGASLRNATLDN